MEALRLRPIGAVVIVSDVRMLATGLARSWREHRAMLLVVWLATGALCAWAAAVGGLYYFQDFRTGSGPKSGEMTVFSAYALVAAGVGLTLVARRVFERRRWSRATLAWAVGGAGGFFLAFDELTQIHEGIARRLARAGVPAPFGFGDRDLYVFATYGLLALFAARGAWPELRRWSDAWLPGVAAVVFFATSSAVDAVPWEGLTRSQQNLWGPVEEILKTLGTVSIALFGMLLAEAAARDPSLAVTGEGTSADPGDEAREPMSIVREPEIRPLVRERRDSESALRRKSASDHAP